MDYKNSPTGRNTAEKYADIIHLSRPESEASIRKHPRMSLENRAKIFSPFAALRGYEKETAKKEDQALLIKKPSLSQEEIEKISDQLIQVQKGMTISVTYFKKNPDVISIEPYGEFEELTGIVSQIDPVFHTIKIKDTTLSFDDILQLSGNEIKNIDKYLGIE